MLFQEITEYIGLSKLLVRLRDATMAEAFEGLFPRDYPRIVTRMTRFGCCGFICAKLRCKIKLILIEGA